MLPISLNLKNKRVLVVGGGMMGRRKAQQLATQGAEVYIIAKEFDESWTKTSWTKLSKAYDKADLKGMFLVYAATDDRDVNHQIVMDCQALEILCSSVTYDDEASFHAMAFQQDQSWQIAVSTGSPIASKELLEQVVSLAKSHQQRWQLQTNLRRLVVQRNPNQNHTSLFLWLNQLTTQQLIQLSQVQQTRQVRFLVFHGVSNPQAILPLKQFYQLVYQKDTPALLCFINQQAVTSFDQSEVTVFDMQTLFQFAIAMQWNVKVEAMLLFQGEMMKRVQQACPNQFELTKPLVERGEWLLNTIQILKETYPNKKLILISHEPLPCVDEDVIVQTILEKHPIATKEKTQTIAFLLLPGRHVQLDCNSDQQQVISLLENPKIRQGLANLIHQQ